jgi:hypothetical protein
MLAGMIATFGSCSQGGPKVHPIKGRVVTARPDDLKSLVGQAVELQAEAEPETRGFGPIQPDGSFIISTYRQGKSLDGAIEGSHKARLMIDLGDEDGRPTRKKLSINRRYTQFENSGWTVSVPAGGDVILKLE